jgi:hypothetical protein
LFSNKYFEKYHPAYRKIFDKKRAALSFQREGLCIKGKNPALGIFPKAAIYTKTALKKNAASKLPARLPGFFPGF